MLGFSAFAQEDGNRDANGKIVRGPYQTNSFGSNWFISVGGGVDVTIDGIRHGGKWDGGVTPTFDASVGKWFSPVFGARLGYEGFALKAAGEKNSNHLVHGDILLNASNLFGGYKQTRVYNIIPYLQAGIMASKTLGREFEMGAGLLSNFRICDHWAINIDCRYSHFRGEQIGCDGQSGLFTASVGVTWNIGKATWKRAHDLDDAYAALKSANEALEAANKGLTDDKDALSKKNAKLQKEIDELKNRPLPEPVKEVVNEPLTLFFGINSAELSEVELRRLKFFMANQDVESLKFNVSGSADLATGPREFNEKLSAERAETIVKLLKSYGVKDENISVNEPVLSTEQKNPEFGRATIIVHE